MRPIQIYFLNIVALLTLGLSVALTQHFYEVRGGTAGFKSYCNMSSAMNCDVVAASPYAELVNGLPVSSFGAGWALCLFIVSLIAHNRFWRREAIRIGLGLTTLGLLTSAYYLLLMAFRLKTYCLLCLGVDALALISFALVFSLKPEPLSVHKIDQTKWKIILPALLIAQLIAVFALTGLNSSHFARNDIAELGDQVLNSPVVPVKIDESFPSFGPTTAPITIVEFSDFQCPFCRMGALTIHSILNRFPNSIRVVFRNYPLDQACNPGIGHTPHPVACEAGKVAYCAYKKGQFEGVYQNLFEQQGSFSPGKPLQIAEKLGMDRAWLDECARSADTAVAIEKDIREANLLGVKSTPTFFINGHKMEGAYPAQSWNYIIEHLLSGDKTGP